MPTEKPTLKILHIVGARPQFIKLFALHLEMKGRGFNQKILHTGQHFDHNMSDSFFDELSIPAPDFNLNIHGLSHGAMTGQMIEGIEKILIREQPHYVIVYGDTNSTLAGAIAAKKLKLKVVHVEAGLRNFDNEMPEELNRILTDRISDILFCPTQPCEENLKKEGMPATSCINTGDILYDCIGLFKGKLKKPSTSHILFTCHREENTTPEALSEIVGALNELSKEMDVIFPVHPRTHTILTQLHTQPTFDCIPPTSYLEFLELINQSQLVITDSGGAVREAFFLKKPSILLLENAVWPELVSAGACFNCSPDKTSILNLATKLMDLPTPEDSASPSINFVQNIFGDANARKHMVNFIEDYE